jgi:hypothetical protein
MPYIKGRRGVPIPVPADPERQGRVAAVVVLVAALVSIAAIGILVLHVRGVL